MPDENEDLKGKVEIRGDIMARWAIVCLSYAMVSPSRQVAGVDIRCQRHPTKPNHLVIYSAVIEEIRIDVAPDEWKWIDEVLRN